MPPAELLEVIDETGLVIAVKTRAEVHGLGLLHREINVWFCTSAGEIVFQHRSLNKDTYPDLLDATVGGHVKIGLDFETSAIEETQEETGLRLSGADLIPLKAYRSEWLDRRTGSYNNVLRAAYLYFFAGALSDLTPEKGEGCGFEAWPFARLREASEPDKRRFVPSVFSPETQELLAAIEERSRAR